MEPSRPAAQEQGGVPSVAAEIETPPGASSAPSTESQLVALLSESRREAQSLRQELELVRRKADADHRQLQALSRKSPDHEVRVFQERLARAEAALEDAETRNRFVERNWLQVERYLIIMQNQAADSRAAFSRLMEEQDGRLVLPNESLSARGRDIPLGDYISSSRSGHHNRSHSNHRRHSPSSSRSPRSPDYIRPLPLTLPRRPPSPPLRSPLGVEDGRWHAAERGDRSPPYKRQRASGRDEFQPGSSRSPSPLRHRNAHPSPPPPAAARNRHDPERARHPSREHMPPPSAPPRTEPIRYRPSETLRAYDARNPPLQFIPHRHPPVPPRPLTPPAPPQARLSGVADTPAHQYQHRFHLNAGVHGPRRPVRPGAYETVVFALDSDAQSDGVGRVKEE
ncbi:hypothetical protein B0H14DRAFT_3865975 [Mycena olivaceomarginata]|nr:hypothetical protein B0H14DRAFT_3865975 [Mycena olivaceomarginata]